jgi:hypothetical protein
MRLPFPYLQLSLAVFGLGCIVAQDRPPSTISFGRDVRPILSQHCFKCHGPDVARAAGGLRLDSFAGATADLGEGAAIVPGNPAKSLLLSKVSESDPAMRMPPPDAGVTPLSADEVATLRSWISQGAHYDKHWSFVPAAKPELPQVSNPPWIRNPIDRFVLAKLDESGLKPEAEADKSTLAVRAAQTLTGLPPLPEELQGFLRDLKPGAYERYVDRLIAKPAYGEHQARYWLDAVRYGDTHGLQLDNERAIYPYRDWVVRAFNDDLPFNRFVEWQLAGDLLPNPTTEQLVATGFVRMNLTSNEGGAIPEEFLARNTFDRVDTTSTIFLGLTVGCARCHDHKYDPIRQSDYYGLYAYFNSTEDEPLDGNIALPPPFIKAPTKEQEAQLRGMDSALERMLRGVSAAKAAAWLESNRNPVPMTKDWQISPVYISTNFDEAFEKPQPGEPGQPQPVWRKFPYEPGKDAENLIRKDNASIYVKGTIILDKARTLMLPVSSDDGVRLWLNGKLIHSNKTGRALHPGLDLVKAELRSGENELIAKVVNGGSIDGLNIGVADANQARIERALSTYRRSPSDKSAEREVQQVFLEAGPDTSPAAAYRQLMNKRGEYEAAIPMTLIARERKTPRPAFILKRGLYDQKGDTVDRHIPPALGKLPVGVPNSRLGFARWLTEPSNPLVSRVFVNRLWQQHFSVGIVKTVEDFGSQGEWPANQALLDYLASSFVKSGWSIKKLNRLIVTSAAFRQSSRISPQKLAKDPENRLLSRGPRYRLDAEVIRDKVLACGGILQPQVGGRGFKPYQPDGLWENSSDPASSTHFYVRDKGTDLYRRSVYLFWKRTSPPPVMMTFDAPLRDSCVVRRSVTNTPLQALALLNEPAFLEASRTMAARILASPGSDEDHLRKAFELAFGRRPAANEAIRLLSSLGAYRQTYKEDPAAAGKLLRIGDTPPAIDIPAAEHAAWMVICSSIMNTDEFLTQH